MIQDCYAIEQAIYQRFTGPDRKFDKVDLGRFSGGLRPGLNVAVISGRGARITTSKIKEEVSIILLIAVENIKSEMQRRRLSHPLRLYAVRLLTGAFLTGYLDEHKVRQPLSIAPIEYDSWNEKTNNEQYAKGQMVVEVRFKTAFEFPSCTPDTEDDAFIESLLSGYFLVNEMTGEIPSSPVLESQIEMET